MADETLEIGTVVVLKSGGPAMTVFGGSSEFDLLPGWVRCRWFDEASHPMGLSEDNFPIATLQVVKK